MLYNSFAPKLILSYVRQLIYLKTCTCTWKLWLKCWKIQWWKRRRFGTCRCHVTDFHLLDFHKIGCGPSSQPTFTTAASSDPARWKRWSRVQLKISLWAQVTVSFDHCRLVQYPAQNRGATCWSFGPKCPISNYFIKFMLVS